MKLAVVAANGKSGRLIVKEAVARGLDVTAVVRGENKTEALHTLKKDIMDLTKEDLAGFDVVIDAFGIWDPNKMDQHSATLGHLSDILSGSKTRLLVVGGAGSLYVDKDHKTMISDLPDFSEAYLPTAVGMKNSLNALRNVTMSDGHMSARLLNSSLTEKERGNTSLPAKNSPPTKRAKARSPMQTIRSPWSMKLSAAATSIRGSAYLESKTVK